jgi:hypothetical protein
MNVRRPFYILESFVDQATRGLNESRDATITAANSSVNEFIQLRHVRNVFGRYHEIEEFLLQ